MKPEIRLVRETSEHHIDPRWSFNIVDQNLRKCPWMPSSVHYHTFYEVEIIHNGTAKHFLNNTYYDARRGDVFLLRYFDFHAYRDYKTDSLQIYNLFFNGVALPNDVLELFTNTPDNLFGHFEEPEFELLLSDISLLMKEKNRRRIHNEVIHINMMKTLFNKIMLTILRKCLKNLDNHTEKNNASYFQKALAFIQCNFREQLTLADISRTVGVTPNYLGQLFIKNLDMTFSAYVKKIRLEYAKNLLRFYDYGIDQISALSGFSTESHFISCFKKAYGITPKQYIIKNKQSNENIS